MKMPVGFYDESGLPILPVTLRHKGRGRQKAFMIIDTGSTYTTVGRILGHLLGFAEPKDYEIKLLGCVSGTPIKFVFRKVFLQLGNEAVGFETEIAWLYTLDDEETTTNLLGRNTLHDLFRLTFDKKINKISFEKYLPNKLFS